MREDPRRYRIVPIGSGLEPGGNHQLIIAATTTGDTTEEPPMNVTRRTNNVAEAVRDLVKSWQQSAGTAHPHKIRRAGRKPPVLYKSNPGERQNLGRLPGEAVGLSGRR
jgi:hypothetical protein